MRVRIPENVLPGAEGFFLEGSDSGVMLIHGGGGGSASDMRELGQYIFEKTGCSVYAPLLPGFGTRKEELARMKVEDWLSALKEDFELLKEEMQKIMVIGHSMGGVKALYLAGKFPKDVTAVVSISAPTKIKSFLMKLVPFFKIFIKYWKLNDEKAFKKISNGLWVGYEKFPLAIVSQFKKLMKLNNAQLHQIIAPILIIQGKNDEFVSGNSPQVIYDRVSSLDKTIKWFDSDHAILFSKVKEEMFASVTEFITRIRG